MDGYKVGGYIAVCNARLEDSDIARATEIITALGQAIGLALDKAILYGTGTKMPLGIVTRLTQTEDPGNAAEGARPWADLHTSNVQSISGKTDAQLFRALIEAAGAAKGEHSAGNKFWAMNEATYAKLVANAMSINAAGAIVSGVDKQMPVIGGAIETLSFIPNDVIVGGYGDLYPLAERAGTNIAQSEHVRFIEDQTVFKGTARYDGKPAVAEGFVAINIGGGTVAGNAVSFASDIANAG
jgi:HK97 family phage major capsid protein